jgi:hypothetical protein
MDDVQSMILYGLSFSVYYQPVTREGHAHALSETNSQEDTPREALV